MTVQKSDRTIRYFVWRENGGAATKVHLKYYEALDEAKRLTSINGVPFHVLKSVTIVQIETLSILDEGDLIQA